MLDQSQGLHLAIIMDGNGRWATARGLKRLIGHKSGAERVRDIIKASPDLGIKYLTLFAFSTENWKRSEREVNGLMLLFGRYISHESKRLVEMGVRVRFIGQRNRLKPKLQKLMADLEEKTADKTYLHLTIAISYGGRDEITRATRKLAELAVSGDINIEDINEDMISSYMDTTDISDPDIVLRTSGEFRTSNFLPWQAVYAEYIFDDTAWPDFTVQKLAQTLNEFKKRKRRFGAVK